MINTEMLDDVLFDSLRKDPSKESGYAGCHKTANGSWRAVLGERKKTFKSLSDAGAHLKWLVLNNLPTRPPKELTQDYLKEILSYNPETGNFTWLQPRRGHLGHQEAGNLTKTGYIRITVGRQEFFAHRLAVLYMTGAWPTQHVDHVNQVRRDNRWVNIRQATRSQNGVNAGKTRNNTSGFKGVRASKNNKTNPWQAQAALNGKQVHIGSYPTPELAYEAYKTFCQEHHGEFLHHTLKAQQ